MQDITAMITENLPEDWIIVKVMHAVERDLEPRYIAFQYRTETRKRWFRKPVTRTAWKDAGFRSRWEDVTRDWIIRTHNETKKDVYCDLFDVTAKGVGHVAILLNGEVVSRTQVLGHSAEAVAYATLRWTKDDQLTYDNAHYASATRRRNI